MIQSVGCSKPVVYYKVYLSVFNWARSGKYIKPRWRQKVKNSLNWFLYLYMQILEREKTKFYSVKLWPPV
jgi:hypothetical protein